MKVEVMIKLIQVLIQCYQLGVIDEVEIKRYIRLAVSDKEEQRVGNIR